jgi:hypothetical protein
MNQELLKDSAKALRAYGRFLRRFGVLDIKVEKPSPQLLRLRAEVKRLNDMADQLDG